MSFGHTLPQNGLQRGTHAGIYSVFSPVSVLLPLHEQSGFAGSQTEEGPWISCCRKWISAPADSSSIPLPIIWQPVPVSPSIGYRRKSFFLPKLLLLQRREEIRRQVQENARKKNKHYENAFKSKYFRPSDVIALTASTFTVYSQQYQTHPIFLSRDKVEREGMGSNGAKTGDSD